MSKVSDFLKLLRPQGVVEEPPEKPPEKPSGVLTFKEGKHVGTYESFAATPAHVVREVGKK